MRLSKKRKAAAALLAAKVIAELDDLSMSKTQFQVMLQATTAEGGTSEFLVFEDTMMLRDTGFDKATILIAPNVGEALKPLASIASGGELSRVVLAIKAIMAATDSVETIIFDEVDAGIGGGVAEVVGQKLAQLARRLGKATVSERSMISDKIRNLTVGGEALIREWGLEER